MEPGNLLAAQLVIKGLIYLSFPKPASRLTAGAGAVAVAGRSDSLREVNPALAYSRTAAPTASECAWCGHLFDGNDEHRTGRIRCARCGVATTSPWPSDKQLGEAYAVWYRPAAGRGCRWRSKRA